MNKGFIDFESLYQLLEILEPPLGWKTRNYTNLEKRFYIIQMRVPIY